MTTDAALSVHEPLSTGICAALLADVDWSSHPLGPRESWPPSLNMILAYVLASMESMYLVWGPDRTFFFNDAYAPILGPRLATAMGARFEELWEDAYSSVEVAFLNALRGEASRMIDLPITMARWGEPEETWWTFSFSPVFDNEGAVAGVLCLTNETTSHVLRGSSEKRATTALLETEQSLRRAQEAGRVGIFTIDLATSVLKGSPQFYRLFGLPEAESIAAGLIESLVLPEDKAIISTHASRGSQDMPLTVEYRVRRPDNGEICCIERRAEFECDSEGRPVRLLGVVQDVTNRRRARDELARLNATLEATVVERTQALLLHENIIQSDVTPICAFDTDYRLIAFNRAHNEEFFRVNGFYTKIGDVFCDLFVPEQRDIMRALMTRALEGEPFTVVEEFGKPELGTPFWEMHYSPLRNAAGKVIGAFHHARDISDRRLAQADLEATQEALRQAQKMEAVGQLTGGLAHDFNNLLAGISGSLELIERRAAQNRYEELGRFIDTAQKATTRAAALTHRLLAFSRRQILDPKPTSVSRLTLDLGELIRRTIGPEIDLEILCAPDLWNILVDSSQLENALLNLAINSRDAMPTGGRIVIEMRNCAMDAEAAGKLGLRAGDYLALTVTDNGEGMKPETIERAFDPFFTTKPLGQGTGLGLSMIFGFAQQSGGQVQIASEVGRGTIVNLYLPRHSGDVGAAAERDQIANASPAVSHETVLVVDDEPAIRMLLLEALGELGYNAIEARDGKEGLAILNSNQPIDLLITDVGLPGGMNGRQLADAARTRRQGLKVLFITGYAEHAIVGEGQLDAGFYLLTKPFVLDVLSAKVGEILRHE